MQKVFPCHIDVFMMMMMTLQRQPLPPPPPTHTHTHTIRQFKWCLLASLTVHKQALDMVKWNSSRGSSCLWGYLFICFKPISWTKWMPFRRQYFQMHFHEKKCCNLIKISLKFVPKGPIDTLQWRHKWPVMRKMFPFDDVIMNRPALVKIMAWHQIGEKPLSEPMLTQLNDICVTLGGDELRIHNLTHFMVHHYSKLIPWTYFINGKCAHN